MATPPKKLCVPDQNSSPVKKLMLTNERVSFSIKYDTFPEARPVFIVKNSFSEQSECDPAVGSDEGSEELCMECNDEPVQNENDVTKACKEYTPFVYSKMTKSDTYNVSGPVKSQQERSEMSPTEGNKNTCIKPLQRRSNYSSVKFSENSMPNKQPAILQQSVNKSIQPDICTLYMFQKSSTHGWVNLIHKHIGNTGFYQCSQCPYKELSPCKVAAHFNECHPSVLDIEVKRPCLFMFCRHCDYIGYDKLSMWYHFEQYHSLTNMINANLINPASFSTQLVQMHQVALQTERVIYRCNVCDFLSQSNHNVMLHVLGQHTKDLKDNHCINNGFVQISRLDATHEPLQQPNVLSPPKEWLMTDIFVCTQCQHVTHERTLMDMHCIDNHANLFLLFVCSICGKHCDKPNKMSSHVSEAHAGFNQQSCSVTLVGSNGKEDMQLCDYTKWQNAHLAITAATSTRPSQQLQYHVSHVPITKTASQSYSVPHLSGQTKSKPVAVVTGLSSSSTGSVQKAIPTVSLLKRTPSTHVQKAIPTVSLLKRTPSTHVQKAIPTMSLLKRTPSTHLPQKRNVQAHSLKPLLSLVTNRPAQLQVISSQQQCTMQSTQQQSLVNQTNVSTLRSFVNFVQVVQEQENTLVKRQMATDQKELAQPAAKCVKLPCDVQVVHGSVHHVDLTNVDHPDDTAQHAPVQVCGTMQQLNSPTMCKQLAKNENVTESEQQAENDNLTKVVLLAESDQLTENEQSVESSQEVRYVQLPDGSVQLEIVWHFDDRE